MIYKFLAAFLAASALIYLGSLSVWVNVMGLAVNILLAILLALILFIGGNHVWRQYRKDRLEGAPRLIFKGK